MGVQELQSRCLTLKVTMLLSKRMPFCQVFCFSVLINHHYNETSRTSFIFFPLNSFPKHVRSFVVRLNFVVKIFISNIVFLLLFLLFFRFLSSSRGPPRNLLFVSIKTLQKTSFLSSFLWHFLFSSSLNRNNFIFDRPKKKLRNEN
jgi:hypothetical protein